MRWPAVLTALLGSVVLAVTASGQTPAGAASVTEPQPISKGWLTYAQSLVGREQAVGVVIRESEMFSRVLSGLPADVISSVSESTRGSVTGLMSDGALRCRTALDLPLVPLVLRGTPLSVLNDLVMQDAEASSRIPPGIVGGTVGGASSSRRSGERISQRLEVRVEFGDTLEAALDRLVSVGVPLGWGVIEHDETSTSPCQIVLFTEDTVMMTPYDALLPATPPSRVPR
ncbi:hypothetical protein [Luteitalea sp.]|uniref:hypothetical protein n=1 Tax=Luteitalea sp. TaxID=2004800 RepID=UPI0025C47F6A|nr:hypothetical protein [Luteitalea sp.]